MFGGRDVFQEKETSNLTTDKMAFHFSDCLRSWPWSMVGATYIGFLRKP